jgi:hypothetical protein
MICQEFCARVLVLWSSTYFPNRVAWWIAAVQADGSIDKTLASHYRLHWKMSDDLGYERAVKVEHCGGTKKDIPDHLIIDKTWTMEDLCNPMETYLKKGPQTFKLSDCFGEDDGPHFMYCPPRAPGRKPQQSPFAQFCKTQYDKEQAAKGPAIALVAEEGFLHSRTDAAKAKSAASMKQRVQEQQASAKRRKSMNL